MNTYGFPTSQLIGMLALNTYNPNNDINYNQNYQFQPVSNASYLFFGAPSNATHGGNCTAYPNVPNFPNWLSTTNDQVDLRQVYLKCNPTSGLFSQNVAWGACY